MRADMAFIIVAVVFSLLVAPVNPSVDFGWDEICPKEDLGFCQTRGLQLEIPSPLDRYTVLKELGQGSFGQTWLVSRLGNAVDTFVLKKIKSQVVGATSFYATALREQYFGRIMTGDHVGRFSESFDHQKDTYIVSFFDGISLHDLLYDGMEPSSWWRWLKKTDAGRKIMRVIVFQLVKAADFCHKKNITHRDLKTSNILICFRKDSGSCSEARRLTGDSLTIHLRVIDFGSAVDEFSMHHLYPDAPSSAGQTFYMMAPEALFGNDWLQGPSLARAKYDMWTIGQIIMELVLGTPNVFGPYTVETKNIFRELVIRMGIEDQDSFVLKRVIALSEFCIAVPGLPLYTSSQCSNQSFWEYVKRRDPLHLGFMDSSLVHLVRQLLAGNPNQRLTAREALNHPYFLSSSRDLEVQKEEETETPKKPSIRLCLFFHWGCFNIEEEKRSRYALILERRSEMIKQLKLTL